MELDPSTVKQFADAVKGLDSTLAELRDTMHPKPCEPVNSSSNVNFNVNDGGIGFRVLINLCVIMFVLMVVTVGFSIYTAIEQNSAIAKNSTDTKEALNDMKREQDRIQDYQNAIYLQVPELKKYIDKKE